MWNIIKVYLLSLFILLSATLPTAQAETSVSNNKIQPYVFGVFPFMPAPRLEAIFAPLSRELSQELSRPVRYASASSYRKFMNRLDNDEFDIAYIQPFDYVRIAQGHGYFPIAQRKNSLSGIFAVKEDSRSNNLLALAGKTVTMPPEVAAVSYLGQAALLQAGLIPGQTVTVKHLGGHHSCLQQVLSGKSEACVTSVPALRVFENNMNVKMRVLAETPAVAHCLFVVHPRLDKKDRQAISKVLLTTDLSDVSVNLRNWLIVKGQNTLKPAMASEYEPVTAMWEELSKTK
jgi:phosphonate transport system substrate-binding protein